MLSIWIIKLLTQYIELKQKKAHTWGIVKRSWLANWTHLFTNRHFKGSCEADHVNSHLVIKLYYFVFQALKYLSVTDIVRPICELVRRSEETTGHSVRPGLLFVRPECINVWPNCSFVNQNAPKQVNFGLEVKHERQYDTFYFKYLHKIWFRINTLCWY